MLVKRVRSKNLLLAVSAARSRYEDPDAQPWGDPDFDPDSPPDFEEIESQRDGYVDLAKTDLKALFGTESESVFYQRQLQVMFEKDYFHWVTVRALAELVEEGVIAAESVPLPGTGTITFYRSIGHRYWKRDAEEILKLVSRFSESSFTYALGAQGETLFDAALPTVGFMPTGMKVRSYGGAEWTASKHDLDRVFERDGVAYGTEIKNTLSYMEKEEMEIKVVMCKYLGLRPLFIVRMAPKSYVKFVAEEGGFMLNLGRFSDPATLLCGAPPNWVRPSARHCRRSQPRCRALHSAGYGHHEHAHK